MSEVAEGPVKDGRVLQVIGAVVDVEVCVGMGVVYLLEYMNEVLPYTVVCLIC